MLVQNHRACIENALAAIREHPDKFSEIRRMINRIILEPVDIDEYYPLAERLAALLASMGPETIFTHYFLDNIDPARGCQARYLRFICQDLCQQIDILLHGRSKQRKLQLIKSCNSESE